MACKSDGVYMITRRLECLFPTTRKAQLSRLLPPTLRSSSANSAANHEDRGFDEALSNVGNYVM